MEKIFKSKGNTKLEGWLLIVAAVCFAIVAVLGSTFIFIALLGPLVIFLEQSTRKYIVKENGDLWVKSILGVSQRAVGVNRILYNPSARGWQWRTRQMVVSYQNGLKKGFFPVTPADPEGLIAVLKEKNPGLELQYTYK